MQQRKVEDGCKESVCRAYVVSGKYLLRQDNGGITWGQTVEEWKDLARCKGTWRPSQAIDGLPGTELLLGE